MTGKPLGKLHLPTVRRVAWHVVTLGSLMLAVVLSYVIRFEGLLNAENTAGLSRCLGIVVPIQFFILMALPASAAAFAASPCGISGSWSLV